MECNRHNFLPFCTIFLPFYPPNNLKNQNFEKWKKYGGIITLHLRTTNDDHMMYGSWDMEHDRHNFLSLFGYVLLFYAPNNLENQNFEKMKKYTKNHDHMPYCSWDMVRDECNCYFSFWAIFPFYPRNSPRNQNLKKKRKKRLEISFYTSVPKIMIRHTVLEIRRATDERTDKRKKWHIEVGAHLKNRFGRPSLSQCFFPECPKW